MIRLGVNIDHVATVRNARGEAYPEPVQAAHFAELGGAENITFHLREDRRHIRDRDVWALKDSVHIPLNFELALNEDVLAIALKLKPHAVTFVPEKRQELTTEGGLNVVATEADVRNAVKRFKDVGILTSLFIEPDASAVSAASKLGADAVEFHTGVFCQRFHHAVSTQQKIKLLEPLRVASAHAARQGLQVHLGHGLNYQNAMWMQHIEEAEEANIGHAIVGRAVFVGLTAAVCEMRQILNDVQHKPFITKKS